MNDFKVGDLVFHLRCGLCEIKDISPLKGNEDGPTYYILSPLYGDERGTLVFVPTAKPIFLRELMSKEDAASYVESWPAMDEDHYISDSKKRKQSYEEALKKGDVYLMAPLLVGAMQRKQRDGHLNSMDANFVSKAEPMVLGEISQALGMSYEKAGEMLIGSN